MLVKSLVPAMAPVTGTQCTAKAATMEVRVFTAARLDGTTCSQDDRLPTGSQKASSLKAIF
jgi:hypothetical protein